jgi:hypothetical protein
MLFQYFAGAICEGWSCTPFYLWEIVTLLLYALLPLGLLGLLLTFYLAKYKSKKQKLRKIVLVISTTLFISGIIFNAQLVIRHHQDVAANKKEQLQIANNLNYKIYTPAYMPDKLKSLYRINYFFDTYAEKDPDSPGLENGVPKSVELVYEFDSSKNLAASSVIAQIDQFNKSIIDPTDKSCGVYKVQGGLVSTQFECQQIGTNTRGGRIYKSQEGGEDVYITDINSTRISLQLDTIDDNFKPPILTDSEVVKLFQSLREILPAEIKYDFR